MRKLLIISAFTVLLANPALAVDRFVPLGLGWSTMNIDPAQLTPEQRRALAQTDVYESEAYARALKYRKFQSHMMDLQSDRNSTGTDLWINY